jgi:hypothetical protein
VGIDERKWLDRNTPFMDQPALNGDVIARSMEIKFRFNCAQRHSIATLENNTRDRYDNVTHVLMF